jgi:DNA excision repair protein ERCC-2
LYPAIKAIPEGNAGTIFYLTARTTGKSVAEKAIEDMRIGGLRLKSLTLTAKERICFRPGSACSPDECEYAKGHFDRINGACTELFERDSFTREAIEESARKHRVCPFELSLEMALFSDCVIGDYNYAFDPRVYLRRFFEEECGTYTFLVDEAHNLVDRARDLFSATVEKGTVLALRKCLKGGTASIVKSLTGMNAVLHTHMKRCAGSENGIVDTEPPKSLITKMRNFTAAAERWLAKNIPSPFRDELADVYFAVSGFLKTAERYDERYVTLFTPHGKNLTVTLFCIDPSARMSEALDRCRSAVFFSATLVPMAYFRDILGIGGEARELILPSPFPPENLLVLIADRISTLYRNRDKTSGGIARSIAALVGGRPGNYLVFFPSYAYMTTVHDSFAAMNPDIETIVQTQGMTEQERDSFLGRFNHDNAASLVGFAVMGGVFGEGIDLIGERLGGAVIVGVGLPGISPEREIIRSYFNEHGGRGFEYSYMFPGINKVLQAAGRVIRSETDRGVVLLIDERFGTARYRSLLPVEWVSATVDDNDDIRKQIVAF